MSISTTLSNCYIPQPLSSRHDGRQQQTDGGSSQIVTQQTRTDDRGPLELRQLTLQTDFLKNAQGSAMVELGNTKVLCKVIGPLTGGGSDNAIPSSVELDMDQGVLQVQVRYAFQLGYPTTQWMDSTVQSIDNQNNDARSNSKNKSNNNSTGKLKSWTSSKESLLEGQIQAAVEAAVALEPYPKCLWQLHVTVLRDDGSVLTAALTAASLALVDANVELYDVICASNVVVVVDNDDKTNNKKQAHNAAQTGSNNYIVLADPTLNEMLGHEGGGGNVSTAQVSLAILPNQKQTLHYQQQSSLGGGGRGKVTPKVANEALSVCRNGCRTLQQFIRQHIVEKAAQQQDDTQNDPTRKENADMDTT